MAKRERRRANDERRDIRPHGRTLSRQGLRAAALALALLAAPALAADGSAVLSLRRYELLDQLSASKESGELNFYLRATADSLIFANFLLQSSNKTKIFCTEKIFDATDLRKILSDYIAFLAKINQNTPDVKEKISVVAIVIQKLRESHPCP